MFNSLTRNIKIPKPTIFKKWSSAYFHFVPGKWYQFLKQHRNFKKNGNFGWENVGKITKNNKKTLAHTNVGHWGQVQGRIDKDKTNCIVHFLSKNKIVIQHKLHNVLASPLLDLDYKQKSVQLNSAKLQNKYNCNLSISKA